MTTHADNVSVPGWSGAGYIIIDPKTGEGGYFISGGSNGGFFLIAIGSILLWAALFAWSASGGAAIFLGVSMVSLLATVMLAASLFVVAGMHAILGDSVGCMLYFNLAVAMLTVVLSVALRKKSFIAPVMGFFSKRNARNICGA